MKTSTLLKAISAVGILGTAVFSVNANAEGGCPAGSVPQQGQGWQTCVPIPNYGGSSTPSRPKYEESARKLTPQEEKQMWATLNAEKRVIVINQRTNKVYTGNTTFADNAGIENNLMKQCRQEGGQCSSVNSYSIAEVKGKKCATLYKMQFTSSTGKNTSYDYFVKGWNTPAERAEAYAKIKKYYDDNAIKDVCFN